MPIEVTMQTTYLHVTRLIYAHHRTIPSSKTLTSSTRLSVVKDGCCMFTLLHVRPHSAGATVIVRHARIMRSCRTYSHGGGRRFTPTPLDTTHFDVDATPRPDRRHHQLRLGLRSLNIGRGCTVRHLRSPDETASDSEARPRKAPIHLGTVPTTSAPQSHERGSTKASGYYLCLRASGAMARSGQLRYPPHTYWTSRDWPSKLRAQQDRPTSLL